LANDRGPSDEEQRSQPGDTAHHRPAHKSKVGVIAAGVETNEQMGFFKVNACDEIQGYLISQPLAIDEMNRMLEKAKKS
jgi:EAL domain-containing protein (putative c-di-GMP-specific phosphodiesterase class I)